MELYVYTGLYVHMGLYVHSYLSRLTTDGGKWGDGYLCPTNHSETDHLKTTKRWDGQYGFVAVSAVGGNKVTNK